MSSSTVLPFLALDELPLAGAANGSTGFEASFDGDSWFPLVQRQRLGDWAPGIDLHVRVNVGIDVVDLRERTSLDDVLLTAVARWYAQGTRIRGVGADVSLGDDNADSFLQFIVPGDLIDGRLSLEMVVVRTISGDAAPLAAGEAASMVARRRIDVLLSGTGGRFPIEFVDLEGMDRMADAVWYVEWVEADDLERPVDGAMTLLVDERRRQLFERINSDTDDTDVRELLLQIEQDIIQSLITRVFLDVELDRQWDLLREDPELVDSVGATAIRLASQIFPQSVPQEVAEKLRLEPALVAARIRSLVRRRVKT